MASPARPLLVSPPGQKQPYTPPPTRGGGPKNPKKARQAERLNPKFLELQEALDAQRGALQRDAAGVAPEQVLVFETNGPVKDLYEVVSRTPGLEWLADEDLRDLAPDEDFFVAGKPTKKIGAQVYLVLFNQTAIEQLLGLWKQWCANAAVPATHRQWLALFRQLRDIRRWSAQDRARGNGRARLLA